MRVKRDIVENIKKCLLKEIRICKRFVLNKKIGINIKIGRIVTKICPFSKFVVYLILI